VGVGTADTVGGFTQRRTRWLPGLLGESSTCAGMTGLFVLDLAVAELEAGTAEELAREEEDAVAVDDAGAEGEDGGGKRLGKNAKTPTRQNANIGIPSLALRASWVHGRGGRGTADGWGEVGIEEGDPALGEVGFVGFLLGAEREVEKQHLAVAARTEEEVLGASEATEVGRGEGAVDCRLSAFGKRGAGGDFRVAI